MIEDVYDATELIVEDESSVEDVQEQKEVMKEPEKEIEYVDISMAATMSDRSEKTIRNWLKAGLITGQKEDPSIKTSRWLINRESLMGHLATSVETDPPRKSGAGGQVQVELPPVIEQKVEDSEAFKALQEQNESLRSQLEELQKQLQKKENVIQKKEHQIDIVELKLEQREEIIEVLKQNQPNVASLIAPYERKIESLELRLAETEHELIVVRDRYNQECSKGLFARIFSPPQELQLLVDKGEE